MALREVAVVGVATTEQLRSSGGRYGLSYGLEALKGALADAGLEKADIQGLYPMIDQWPQTGEANPGNYLHSNWPAQLGIPIRWFTGAVNSGAGTGASAILDAAAAIAAGYIDTAAIVLGMAASTPADTRTASWTSQAIQWNEWTGTYTAAQFALAARRHMHEFGTAPEHFAQVSATIRNYGHLNPDAVMYGRGPYSVQDVLDAPMVADPLTRLMCAQVNDGGAAMILSTLERARDLRKPVVRVLGGADQLSYPAYAEPPLLEHALGEPFSTRWVDDGFAMAGLTRDDVDVVELYDGFASWIVMQWELLGFCARGEGGPFVASGVMELDGRYPTCTDGGCESFSHMGAPALLRPLEAVRQLRVETPDPCPGWEQGKHSHEPGACRQVRDPRIALGVSMGPPTGGGNFVLLARD
ncbi:MAG: thiolase family protein [Myxococcales bacterium]|nr:thiolase family protein [Myxococcales bacterium]